LSDSEVIKRVSTSCVPVAVNLYNVRRADDAGGALFHSVQQQKDQYQGIWIVSPNGKVLAGHQDYKDEKTWSREVLDTIDGALEAFGPVKPRRVTATEPLPHRGVGVAADGSVSLAFHARLMRGGGRSWIPTAANRNSFWLWDGDLRPDGPPVIDSLTLTAKEWAALSPPRAEVGAEWAVPQALAAKFARAIVPVSDQSAMPLPEEANVARLTARVESIEKGRAHLRLAGQWETDHVYDKKHSYACASAEGIAVLDVDSKTMRSLLLIFSGFYRSAPPYDQADRPTGAVVEWRESLRAR
jgi:hypothetical protein